MDAKKVILITVFTLLIGTALIGGTIVIKKKMDAKKTISAALNDPQYVFGQNPDGWAADVLNAAERIYRVESANFTSDIYNNTYSAGMVATSNTTPFGWTSLATTWETPKNAPVGTFLSPNGKTYVRFPDLRTGVYSLCKKLTDYKSQNVKADYWNAGATGSPTYLTALDSIPQSGLISPNVTGNILLS